MLGQRREACVEDLLLEVRVVRRGVFAREHRRVRGQCPRRCGERAGEREALGREPIQVRRRGPVVSVGRKVIGARRVEHDHEHVRHRTILLRRGERQEGGQGNQQQQRCGERDRPARPQHGRPAGRRPPAAADQPEHQQADEQRPGCQHGELDGAAHVRDQPVGDPVHARVQHELKAQHHARQRRQVERASPPTGGARSEPRSGRPRARPGRRRPPRSQPRPSG